MSTGYRDVMREVAKATAPSPTALARVRARIDAGLHPTTDLLGELGEPDPVSVARVRARLRAQRRRNPAPWVWTLGGTVAAAAALALFVTRPPATSAATTLALSADQPTTVQASEHVQLVYDGAGSATGLGNDWTVEWESGRLLAEVTPDAGASLAVETRDARVEVLGTRFVVERDVLGTAVEVERGRVAVHCHLGGAAEVGAGAEHFCLPSSASGLLARALALGKAGAEPTRLLETLDLGLDHTDDRQLRAELLAHRLGPLVALGRTDDALTTAEEALELDSRRPEELHRAAARLALAAGKCQVALPHLEALAQPTPEEVAHQRACLSEPDPP